MNKPSPLQIVLFVLFTIAMLTILGYSTLHQTSLERTLLLLTIIAFLFGLSIRFYFKSVHIATSSYQNLFNGSPLAIYIMAKGSLKILNVNKAMVKLYGYTEKEFSKMTALDIRPEEDHEEFKRYVVKEKEPDESGIALHQKKNGEKFYVRFNFHSIPLIKEDAVLVMITDIDENIKNEKRIGELLHLYEAVNQATHDVIWDYDLLENKITWMEGFEEIYGYTEENRPYDFNDMTDVYYADRDKVQHFFADVIANKQKDWILEYRFRCADGTIKYVRDRGLSVFNKAGEPIRLIGAMQDIDKQKRYEQELVSRNEQLEEIAWINSHEVRRPLSNILALARMIKEYPNPSDELSTLIEYLYASSQELDDAVNLINKRTRAEV
ncbi:PAS domain S-box protein [Mucilaginibacter jinjuensis]|uniref:histidine kinase n=1 Tax=Mucilaginibacter jinjuensis TaxID=1176721 RepID=A0ABY7T9J1_9SPHI|nr:PAS domain S-box protein [Mucilaginibacter jinjuensis]WCT13154.1 PAS domain S-box protein [Mucilaginibacter jinjuensis]